MTTSMRILHYIRSINNEDGGVVRAVIDHCKISLSCSDEVTLLTTNPVDIPEEWCGSNDYGPEIIDLKLASKWTIVGIVKKYQLIKKSLREADVVYLHELWRPENVLFSIAAGWAGKPYIVPIYGMLSDWAMNEKRTKKKIFHALMVKRFLEKARLLQCVHHAELEQAKAWAPAAAWAIIPYLVDIDVLENEAVRTGAGRSYNNAEQSYETKFLFLSRLHPKKGFDLLIDAAMALHELNHSFKVIVAGCGDPHYVREIQSRIKELKIDDQFEFIGPRFGAEKIKLFQSVDALVLPTHNDNFGLVLVEAMGYGVPVITTRNVDIWRVIQTGGAIIIDSNAVQLTDAMGKIIQMSDEEKSDIGRRSRSWVAGKLDPRKIAVSYNELHRLSLLPKRKGEVFEWADYAA